MKLPRKALPLMGLLLMGWGAFALPAFSETPVWILDGTEEESSVLPPASSSAPRLVTLSELKAMKEQQKQVEALAEIEPASGKESAEDIRPDWVPETEQLSVEAVLVPRRATVISSSQDGKIAEIPFESGDSFKAGDVLVQYDCADLAAEREIAGIEKKLTGKKKEGVNRLFKLDIISDVDRLSVETEDKQAAAKVTLYQSRLESCTIRAQFDGRVTKRLANSGEYTRTDRVLMEVASNEPLQAQFLLPSKWLRWVNTGAPLTISINETERKYSARVSRLYGEIDPVSQSIQMVATLDAYSDPLLPGMSGKAVLDVGEIQNAGVRGYLQSAHNP